MRLRQVNQHLGRRFRIQRKLKCKSYSIDSAALRRLLNGIVWCDNWSEPAPSPRVVLAKAFIDVPPFSNWQRHSKLILPAPGLCVSADNGLSDDGFQEARWRNELRSSGSHLGLRDHATHAAIVIGVPVAVAYCHDRLAWTVRKIEVESFARCSGCTECVDDNETGRTFHDRHIRLRETADLINAVGDLKQSVCGVELRLTPKTWIYGRRRLVLTASSREPPENAAELFVPLFLLHIAKMRVPSSRARKPDMFVANLKIRRRAAGSEPPRTRETLVSEASMW